MKHILPPELKGKELFEYLVKNEALIFHAKKTAGKEADSVFTSNYFVEEGGNIVSKAAGEAPVISGDASKLNLQLVINTTNYFDSHYDVHIPGLWDKSLKDNGKPGFYLLNAHQARFEQVIGEGMKGKAVTMGWKDLGFNYTGVTQALMFSGTIDKVRNPFMFDQYARGYVKQHSVGMQYVKIVTCINEEEYPVQKENWDKYFPMVVNKAEAEASGFFWAVLEAKVREGSAVVFGSNDCTPTHMVEEAKSNSTVEEPVETTLEQQPPTFDIQKAIREAVFLK